MKIFYRLFNWYGTDLSTYRSGFNKHWVSALGNASTSTVNNYFDRIATTPLRECDGKVRCERVVSYVLNFHGCSQLCLCDYHLEEWIWRIKESIRSSSPIGCSDCRKTYESVNDYMTWRFI